MKMMADNKNLSRKGSPHSFQQNIGIGNYNLNEELTFNPNSQPNPQTVQRSQLNFTSHPTFYLNRASIPARSIPTFPTIKAMGLNTTYPNQTIYEQQQMKIPPSVQQIQYIPHLNRYMDYVEKRVKVPVERFYTDYYQVQHVTDFVPRQYQETLVQIVPEETITYRLTYVPVEKKIVHLPKDNLGQDVNIGQDANTFNQHINYHQQNIPMNAHNQTNVNYDLRNLPQTASESQINHLIHKHGIRLLRPSQEPKFVNDIAYPKQQIRYVNEMTNSKITSKSKRSAAQKRTNYVTSDGYFPSY